MRLLAAQQAAGAAFLSEIAAAKSSEIADARMSRSGMISATLGDVSPQAFRMEQHCLHHQLLRLGR
jgi:hypothetical protein